jgi:hypothetical protein
MATIRQIRANQQNAKRSTGARTEEGKHASSRNGLTHGMTAAKQMHDDEEAILEARRDGLTAEYKPVGPREEAAVRRIIAAEVRIEWCDKQEEGWRYRKSERAELNWDDDRQAEVLGLARKLAQEPEIVALKIRQTPQGCAWLVKELRGLQAALAQALAGTVVPDQTATRENGLDDQDRSRAFDLLGVEAWHRKGRTILDPVPDSGLCAAEHQATALAGVIAELEERRDTVTAELDATDRTAALTDRGPGIDSMYRLIRRYQLQAERQRRQAVDELQQLQRESAAARLAEEEARRQAEFVRLTTPRRVDDPRLLDAPSAPPTTAAPQAPQQPMPVGQVARPRGLAEALNLNQPRNRRERLAQARAAHRTAQK